MLYVSTRSNCDAYTAQRVLRDGRAPDGGLFAPFRLPVLSEEEIAGLGEMPFSQRVARGLNLLFNTRLSHYEVELAVGRYGVRLKNASQKILLAQCWHNTRQEFSDLADNLMDLVRVEKPGNRCSGEWAEVGARIAVLFGIYGELIAAGLASRANPVDISMVSGDFSGPISAFYARQMGLPIGSIICCCNENGGLWDLFAHGQLRTDGVAVSTVTPGADVVIPVGLERLIHFYGGAGEVQRFVTAVHMGQTYHGEGSLRMLRQGMYAAVCSDSRILSAIPSVYATSGCVLSPYTALAWAGLQDYRVRTGQRSAALVLSDRSPVLDSDTVARAMGISTGELEQML